MPNFRIIPEKEFVLLILPKLGYLKSALRSRSFENLRNKKGVSCQVLGKVDLSFGFKVTGDSLLIQEFAYSLIFTSLCSVTSNMTGYSHSYNSIKLIHSRAPQRDVLSDKMVLWVVTHGFYFMLCQSSLLSTVIIFVYKDKWWFDESMSVIFCMENTWKRILLFPLHINFSLNQTWKLCN